MRLGSNKTRRGWNIGKKEVNNRKQKKLERNKDHENIRAINTSHGLNSGYCPKVSAPALEDGKVRRQRRRSDRMGEDGGVR